MADSNFNHIKENPKEIDIDYLEKYLAFLEELIEDKGELIDKFKELG